MRWAVGNGRRGKKLFQHPDMILTQAGWCQWVWSEGISFKKYVGGKILIKFFFCWRDHGKFWSDCNERHNAWHIGGKYSSVGWCLGHRVARVQDRGQIREVLYVMCHHARVLRKDIILTHRHLHFVIWCLFGRWIWSGQDSRQKWK